MLNTLPKRLEIEHNRDGETVFRYKVSYSIIRGFLVSFMFYSTVVQYTPSLWREKDFVFHIYPCFFFHRNSQRMPGDVTEALLEIFMKEGKMDKTQAEEFLKRLESTKHFQSETWS